MQVCVLVFTEILTNVGPHAGWLPQLNMGSCSPSFCFLYNCEGFQSAKDEHHLLYKPSKHLPFCAIAEVGTAKMKVNPLRLLTGAKNHKRHFNVLSHFCRKIMSSPLSKELRHKYNMWYMPIQKNDEFQVVASACG